MKNISKEEIDMMEAAKEIIKPLTLIPDGFYKLGSKNPFIRFFNNKGWLEVIHENNRTTIWLKSHRDSHNRASFTGRCISIKNDGSIFYSMEVYWSLHLVWGYGRYSADKLQAAIDSCKYCLEQYNKAN